MQQHQLTKQEDTAVPVPIAVTGHALEEATRQNGVTAIEEGEQEMLRLKELIEKLEKTKEVNKPAHAARAGESAQRMEEIMVRAKKEHQAVLQDIKKTLDAETREIEEKKKKLAEAKARLVAKLKKLVPSLDILFETPGELFPAPTQKPTMAEVTAGVT
ncbi:hypothetical protein GGI25_004579 [Coemansia spiralis]|uniref:Uncharacterized protein n=2 Tax=Coemansia TaxID=4863 RepID=A0A9W8G5Y1_9FUNG|nr:hypothetical protein EDC05_004352 [Coemansia umbellata]KAJ2620631.1 hypothetical protein GGI26_004793 [Coemansia sp. RSA 1358]KAJ2673832.1 hypothetical protein GGI25_004579 [Coemansia spiralis]